MQNDELIKKLNKALEWEYAAAIQYIQHSSVMTGGQYGTITEEMVVHSKEEMDHAVTVSAIITSLGGNPTINVEKREISPDSKTMLEQDLAGEELAIVLYQELIKIAEEKQESNIKQKLEEILKQEEEHKTDLQKALTNFAIS